MADDVDRVAKLEGEIRDLTDVVGSLSAMLMVLIAQLRTRGALSPIEAKVVFAAAEAAKTGKLPRDPREVLRWATASRSGVPSSDTPRAT